MKPGESASGEKLSGAWNFRDVAEAAGIAPGVLFRSSELSKLDEAGRRVFTDIGVTDVADLRSPTEVARRGAGAVPDGVTVHNLPFPEVTNSHDAEHEAPHETSWNKMMTEHSDEDPAEAALRWMTQEYERFPTLPGSLRAVRRITTLLAGGRPTLVHCFAGKDRTGFALAVVLEAAGVKRDAIIADYLRSNAAVGALRDSILATMRTREGMTDEVLSFAESRLTDEVLGVREEYLESARRVVDETHGGLAGWLRAAEVGDEDIAALRSRLLG